MTCFHFKHTNELWIGFLKSLAYGKETSNTQPGQYQKHYCEQTVLVELQT